MGLVRRKVERVTVDSVLADLTVKGHAEQNILELSGGTQQKIVLARALLKRPNILLLDDPTRGIDVATKHEIYRLFKQLAANGVGLLWHSTELSELRHCDRVYVMRGGQTVGEIRGDERLTEQVLELSFSHGKELGSAQTSIPYRPSLD
jgi:ribose transport system ATP-binding protein